MMITSQAKAHFIALIALLIALGTAQAGIRFSGQCDYKGYAPGSVAKVRKTTAFKPANFETSVLQKSLAYFNTGSGVTAATLGVIDAVGDIMKAAPQLTAAIGILSVGVGFLQESPSPQDILDKAYESVKLLSDEVNLMMDQMIDYVDAKDLQLERNIMKNTYKELFDRWTGCGKEATVVKANECQRRAVKEMSSSRYHFQPLHSKFKETKTDYRGRNKLLYNPDFDYRASAGTWQWMKKECGDRMECLSHEQVKRLEIGVIPFRDYATLHLLALKTLEASYREQPLKTNKVACREYKNVLDDMATKGDDYASYAKWAKEWTYIRQYEENDFFGVRGRSGGRPAGAFRGGFLGTQKCSGNKCTIECTQMLQDKTCSATGGSYLYLKDKLENKCEAYVLEVKKQLNTFWDENVLNAAKLWKEYSEDAKKKQETVKCES